jgi:hypothetical protein
MLGHLFKISADPVRTTVQGPLFRMQPLENTHQIRPAHASPVNWLGADRLPILEACYVKKISKQGFSRCATCGAILLINPWAEAKTA